MGPGRGSSFDQTPVNGEKSLNTWSGLYPNQKFYHLIQTTWKTEQNTYIHLSGLLHQGHDGQDTIQE